MFRQIPGVIDARSGYSGGGAKDPTYEDVCTGATGHAESVLVTYDDAVVAYGRLLEAFWSGHDPTTPNRQGPDIGTQYRSAIFFHTPAQEAEARRSAEDLARSGRLRAPIVTQILPASEFYEAEEYHQQYIRKAQAR
ncbi:MAG: peptide-methionine (S)-S-oxide reductase [Thaumarchaeota archaeon S15]|nr:MAG: peptide-methionine (S)-S-oxide reductase [Thaumarchaeota archaeon S13]RNJ72076.1 MAG: peptide-methionine (S)-S-oxide reductase [Thaumarchaeota archaeon S14]RNJ74455.1 MAG: peptide-methionine (S)-S-oxide reductase [Thaumarchaeota archaeon S15]